MKGAKPLECDILLERDRPITLRDGVTIYADIFRPTGDEKRPAIVALSPYGKEIGTQWLDDVPMRAGVPKKAVSGLQKFEGSDPCYWVKQEYAVVNPDVRGAYRSEGVILFFGSDYGKDGRDIVDHIGEQGWCNGKVGLSGNSWLAISQWFTAAEHPRHLAAIAPWEGLTDCYREVGTRGGVIMPSFVELLSASFVSTPEGEYLQITVCAYKTSDWASPFDLKMAKIKVPRDTFTYMPGEKVETVTVGGVRGGLTGGIDTADLPRDVNQGRHAGRYDSFLYLPVIPRKDN